MDDVPDRPEDDEARTDRPVARPEPTGPATDRVRIFGAEPAGETTAVVPAVPRDTGSDRSPSLFADDGPDADDRSEIDADDFGQPKVRLTGEPAEPDSSAAAVRPVNPGQTAVPSSGAAPTELPHWTEPPTGQVPAVLARDAGDEGSGSGIGGPTWREEDADWTAHDEEFEPAMLGDDDVALGSLDETDSTDVDRRPWEFDLDSVRPGAASPSRPSDVADRDDPALTIAPITEPTEVVTPLAEEVGHGHDQRDSSSVGSFLADELSSGPEEIITGSGAVTGAGAAAGAGAMAAAGAGAADPAGDDRGNGVDREPADPDGYPTGAEVPRSSRPTGATRAGRARRNGLLPARLRAKRPDDVDVVTDTPLAAEPPGASVTDVPGVGLKRGGVVGLAAADRSAQRDGEPQGVDIHDPATDWSRPGSDGVDLAATAAVAAGVPRRRPRRWSASDSSGDAGRPRVPMHRPVGDRPRSADPAARRRTATHRGGRPRSAAARSGCGSGPASPWR